MTMMTVICEALELRDTMGKLKPVCTNTRPVRLCTPYPCAKIRNISLVPEDMKQKY